MSDTILAYLVSLGIIFAGVVWIIAGTIWTASDLCIAIGMVTIVGSRKAGVSRMPYPHRAIGKLRSANGWSASPLLPICAMVIVVAVIILDRLTRS